MASPTLRHAGAEFLGEHRAAGAARELRVAHSEYSGPLSRRMALLGLVATDPSEVPATLDEESQESLAAGAADAP
jgi:hypothetical protein